VPAANHEISRKDFEASIERKVDLVIPSEQKIACQAAKLGQPFAKVATAAKVSQPFNQLVAVVTSTVEQAEGSGDGSDGSKASLLKKLNLKGLLSKAPAKA
jgi:pilus assembly protein CpaE